MSLVDDNARRVAGEMELLREDYAEGQVTPREFNRKYGALARQLLGDREYEHLHRRIGRKRRRRAAQ